VSGPERIAQRRELIAQLDGLADKIRLEGALLAADFHRLSARASRALKEFCEMERRAMDAIDAIERAKGVRPVMAAPLAPKPPTSRRRPKAASRRRPKAAS
jgi:hypothetical protein